MPDNRQSPPAPKLPDDYEMPDSIRQVLGQVPPATAFGQERRTELDARLAVMVASELNRATHAVSANLMDLGSKVGGLTKAMEQGASDATSQLDALTGALRDGAKALNGTVETGNQLSRRVWLLNVLVVVLMLVQIGIAVTRH